MSNERWASAVLAAHDKSNEARQVEEAAQLAQRGVLQSGHHPSHLAFGADDVDPETHLPATFERTRVVATMSKQEGGTQDREATRAMYDAHAEGSDGNREGSLVSSRDHDFMHRMAPFPSSMMAPPGMDGARQISVLQAKLQQRLGPEYIASRSGPAGTGKVNYIEGWKAVDLANEVFGFNGWSSEVKRLEVDFMDVSADGRVSVGISVILRITLRDGTFHEDVGYGNIENARTKAAAFEKAKKEAVTDACKRALKSFGRLLGNCVYDKKFLEVVTKMKAEPPKYDVSSLKRGPDARILQNGGGYSEACHAQAPTPARDWNGAPSAASAAAGPSSRPAQPAPVQASTSVSAQQQQQQQQQQTSPAKRAATTPAIPNKQLIEEKRREAQRKQEARRQQAVAEAEAKAREAAAMTEASSSVSAPAAGTSTRPSEANHEPVDEEQPPPSQAFRDMDESALSDALSSLEAIDAAHGRQSTLMADSSCAAHDDSGVVLPPSRQHQKGPPPSAWPAAPSMPFAPSGRDPILDSSPPRIVKPEPQSTADSGSTHAPQPPQRSGSKGRFVGGGARASAEPGMTHGITSLSHAATGRSSTTIGITARTHQMLPPSHHHQQRQQDSPLAGQHGATSHNRPIAGPTSARGAPVSYMPPQHGGGESASASMRSDGGFRTALQESSVNAPHHYEAAHVKKARLS